jgi:hypothetical protein
MGRHEAALCHSGLAPKRKIVSPAPLPSARAPTVLCTLLFLPFFRSCLRESPALGVGLPFAQHVQMIVASLRITATRAMVAPYAA